MNMHLKSEELRFIQIKCNITLKKQYNRKRRVYDNN